MGSLRAGYQSLGHAHTHFGNPGSFEVGVATGRPRLQFANANYGGLCPTPKCNTFNKDGCLHFEHTPTATSIPDDWTVDPCPACGSQLNIEVHPSSAASVLSINPNGAALQQRVEAVGARYRLVYVAVSPAADAFRMLLPTGGTWFHYRPGAEPERVVCSPL